MKIRGRSVNRWLRLIAITGILGISATACSANPNTGGGQADAITRNDIAIRGLVSENAYEIVQRLRPAWLRRRGGPSFANPAAGLAVVYLNGTRYGEPEILRQIRAHEITMIQFLGGTAATTRFGLNHDGGAILVATMP
jgi:hypothetical protein